MPTLWPAAEPLPSLQPKPTSCDATLDATDAVDVGNSSNMPPSGAGRAVIGAPARPVVLRWDVPRPGALEERPRRALRFCAEAARASRVRATSSRMSAHAPVTEPGRVYPLPTLDASLCCQPCRPLSWRRCSRLGLRRR